MKIKKILVMMFIIFCIILTAIDVRAAEANIEATKNRVEVGEDVTINVSFTAAAWNLTVSGDKISGDSYASQTSDLSEQTTNKSFELDTSNVGEYTVKISGDITDKNGKTTKVDESVSVKVLEPEPPTVTEPEPEPNEPTVQPEPTTPNNPEPDEPTVEPEKSSDATLKMLGIGESAKKPSKYDFSGFKVSTLNYSITVPYDVEGLQVYYTLSDSKATCSITGNTGFEVGKNEIKVTVTAEDGTQKTYTINVTREEEKSGDATLSLLGIGKSAKEPSEYDFSGFTKNTYEYSVTVPYEVTSLDVYYTLSKSTSIADVSGSSDFKVGENAIQILVTAEDGTQKTYTINVTRESEKIATQQPNENEQNPNNKPEEVPTNQPDTNSLKLETLEISKGKLSPAFDSSITNYSVTVGSSVTKLDITAVANDENATIEIAGNEELKEGKNIITILVRNSDNSEVVTYQINVTQKSGFDVVGFITDTENRNILIILGVILFLIIVIIVLLVKGEKDEEDDDFEIKPKKVKVKGKKSKGKRFKDSSEDVEVSNMVDFAENSSDDTESINK